jgi:hypothetical protein
MAIGTYADPSTIASTVDRIEGGSHTHRRISWAAVIGGRRPRRSPASSQPTWGGGRPHRH